MFTGNDPGDIGLSTIAKNNPFRKWAATYDAGTKMIWIGEQPVDSNSLVGLQGAIVLKTGAFKDLEIPVPTGGCTGDTNAFAAGSLIYGAAVMNCVPPEEYAGQAMLTFIQRCAFAILGYCISPTEVAPLTSDSSLEMCSVKGGGEWYCSVGRLLAVSNPLPAGTYRLFTHHTYDLVPPFQPVGFPVFTSHSDPVSVSYSHASAILLSVGAS